MFIWSLPEKRPLGSSGGSIGVGIPLLGIRAPTYVNMHKHESVFHNNLTCQSSSLGFVPRIMPISRINSNNTVQDCLCYYSNF